MVERKRIKSKPEAAKKELPPEADQWTKGGGIDPEIQQPTLPVPPVPPVPAEPTGKPFPHRVSFDMATEQYRRLKRASAEELRSLNEILRDAVETWLKERDY